jgi:hypothetical protein
MDQPTLCTFIRGVSKAHTHTNTHIELIQRSTCPPPHTHLHMTKQGCRRRSWRRACARSPPSSTTTRQALCMCVLCVLCVCVCVCAVLCCAVTAVARLCASPVLSMPDNPSHAFFGTAYALSVFVAPFPTVLPTCVPRPPPRLPAPSLSFGTLHSVCTQHHPTTN